MAIAAFGPALAQDVAPIPSADLGRRNIPSGDSDIVLYTIGGIALVAAGGGLMKYSSRRRAPNGPDVKRVRKPVKKKTPSPRARSWPSKRPSPDVARAASSSNGSGTSELVARLKNDVRRWADPS